MALNIDDETLAKHVDQVAEVLDGPLQGGQAMILHAAATRLRLHHAAARQAGTTTSGPAVGAVDVLQALGIAVHTGTLVPSGAAVRLDIDDTARWLEPSEARTLAVALEQAAMNAMHEDRAARRG